MLREAVSAGWRSARLLAADLLDFAYPPRCVICQREVTTGQDLCGSCRDALAPAAGDVCQRCCAPVGPNLPTTAGCHLCREERFAFECVFALGNYQGLLQSVCRRAKRDEGGVLVPALVRRLFDRWRDELESLGADVIVPIPFHWTQRLLRIPNPAAAAAQALSRLLKTPCDLHILAKSRRTRPQTSLTPTARRNNLRRAFRLVRGVDLAGTKVLLVDDVLTTGTTAHRAAAVLRAGGASQVFVAVVARGVGI